MDVKLNFTFGTEVSEKKSDFAINLVSHYEDVANVNFNEYEFKRFLKYPLQMWLLQTVGCPPRKTKCVLSFCISFGFEMHVSEIGK